MTRQHPTWSCPHIQAAKMGKVEVLENLLATYRSSLSKLSVSPQTSLDGHEHHIKRFHHPLGCIRHARDCTHQVAAANRRRQGRRRHEDGYSRLSSHTLEPEPGAHQNSSTRADSAKLPRTAPFPQSSPARVVQEEERGSRGSKRKPTRRGSDSGRPPCDSTTTNKPVNKQILQVWLAKMQDLLAIQDATTGHTAMHYVAEDGNLQCLKVLLKYGAVIDLRNAHGQTPLHCACYENRRDVAEFLIAHGSRLNQREYEKLETPLMVCIRTRNDSLALMIVKYMRIRERHGYTEPLDEPAGAPGGELSVEKGQTALYYAVYFSRFEIVHELFSLESAVAEFLADDEGRRAACSFVTERLSSAKEPHHQHVMRKLLKLCQSHDRRCHMTEPPISVAQLGSYQQQSSLPMPQVLDVPSSSPSLASSRSVISACNADTMGGIPVPAGGIPNSDSSCYCMECLGFVGSDCSDAFIPSESLVYDEAAGSAGPSSSSSSNGYSQRPQHRSSRLRRARDKMKLAAKKPFQMFKHRTSDVTN
eukprot:Protomagalhaensia_sp_Gyna_25__6129@NODE_99_length_5285_cov_19_953298_g76_i0_p2_GENE_NODE_99_length_5285_cov_19_953298_g76_i0NODE_99_length_5285_cov_19_953298_g76_i0_p2_ORF_typecomplete_len549_score52_79Ank_2/PF12796_7/2_7e02Ank_2/PF12796_7/1_8e17Ank_2/PF12796_7/0_062Ank_2/PF12796_7/0_73Ank_4/PF13637_6/1_2e02Ank_4/PF13637_6/8_2e16Ank_4/PF13637_6/0_00043Ank_4/PF13637_6/0_13Ank_5/PF13857_6/4e02Ank_5/PF13857_6/4_7e11Ank_5/PF13857_6/5_2e10Ank_5/PF13857_6/0_89Ank_3/PF13606_6/9_2e03Ank_3/PF13606_6/0_00